MYDNDNHCKAIHYYRHVLFMVTDLNDQLTSGYYCMYKLLKFTKTNCTNAHVCTHTLPTYKPSIAMRSPKSTNLQVKVGSLWTIKLIIQFIGNFLTC